jgi:hypothetical protein
MQTPKAKKKTTVIKNPHPLPTPGELVIGFWLTRATPWRKKEMKRSCLNLYLPCSSISRREEVKKHSRMQEMKEHSSNYTTSFLDR